MQSLGYSNNPIKALYFNMHIFNDWLNIIFQKKLWHYDFTIVLLKYNIFPLSFILKHQNVIFASDMNEFEWKTISQGFPPLPTAEQFSVKSSSGFNVVYSNI